MICRPAKRIGLLSGLVIGLTLAGVSAVIWQGLLRQPLGLGFFLTAVILLGALFVSVVWLYRFVEFASLRYQMDRNALTIAVGFSHYVIPLDAIDRVIPGADLAVETFRGTEWPGFLRGRARVEGLPPLHILGTQPLERQLVIVARRGAYGISPQSPSAFVEALQVRRALGVVRQLEEGVERDSLATWAVWRDRLLWAMMALTLAANLALFGFIFYRYGSLPERISLHFDALGEVDRVSSKVWLLIVPAIGAFAFVLNAIIGVVLYARERVGSLLLASVALVLQGVLWLAIRGILGS